MNIIRGWEYTPSPIRLIGTMLLTAYQECCPGVARIITITKKKKRTTKSNSLLEKSFDRCFLPKLDNTLMFLIILLETNLSMAL